MGALMGDTGNGGPGGSPFPGLGGVQHTAVTVVLNVVWGGHDVRGRA